MIHPGICSVGFAHLPWAEVLSHAARAGLKGVEWGAAHVPPGSVQVAREVSLRTRELGLVASSYGSYYRAGVSEPVLPFDRVLETAVALGALTVRVWAGNKDGEEANAARRAAIVGDIARLAEMSARAGVTLGLEYHHGTLTGSPKSTDRLMQEVNHAAVRFYWQPPLGRPPRYCLDSLRWVLPRLANLHVFHWTVGPSNGGEGAPPDLSALVWPEDYHRHPLSDGVEPWRTYLECAATAPGDRWALLEFTKGDAPEQMAADARTLATLLVNANALDNRKAMGT